MITSNTKIEKGIEEIGKSAVRYIENTEIASSFFEKLNGAGVWLIDPMNDIKARLKRANKKTYIRVIREQHEPQYIILPDGDLDAQIRLALMGGMIVILPFAIVNWRVSGEELKEEADFFTEPIAASEMDLLFLSDMHIFAIKEPVIADSIEGINILR